MPLARRQGLLDLGLQIPALAGQGLGGRKHPGDDPTTFRSPCPAAGG